MVSILAYRNTPANRRLGIAPYKKIIYPEPDLIGS
jgi:hypothetical protein